MGIPAPSQRASAVIFTDYGEAAAINELGRGTELPAAVSADNSE
jgi:hypothetical protein